jgi:hypothetical protein
MRRLVVLAMVLSATAVAWGEGWEGDLLNIGNNIDGTLGVTYDSMYVWRGFRVFDNKSAVHILGDVTIADTGFGISAFGHRANSSGFENAERWDYTAYYQNALFTDEAYATNFRLGWVYYNYPHRNEAERIDLQELHAVMQWPKILGVDGLCPSYVAVKMWPARHGEALPDASSGFAHIFMLDYSFSLDLENAALPQPVVRLHSEVVYNDGVTPTPAVPNPDHDWSDAVFGVSTDLDFSEMVGLKASSLVFTPGVFYQITMDKSVDPKGNELWSSFGLKYSF